MAGDHAADADALDRAAPRMMAPKLTFGGPLLPVTKEVYVGFCFAF